MQWLTKLACVLSMCAGALAGPINKYCPVGQEPVDPSTPTLQYEGHEIGFCCPGCEDMFLGWNEQRRDEFVKLALAGKEPHKEAAASQPAKAPAQAADTPSYPYTLTTCPVSGEELGHEGDPVVRTIEGREVKFCCEDCVAKFEGNPSKYFEQVDKKLVEQQAMHYPLATCIISGEPLVENGKFTGVDVVYKNRLVRLCCDNCAGKFEKNPAPILEKLDKAMIEQQRAAYPLDTCLVSGEKLGGMGEPVEVLYMNRLVRFCCKMCVPKFEKNPAEYMTKLDKAYADAQRADSNAKCPISGETLDADAVEVVAGQKLIRFCCEKCEAKFKANPDAYRTN